MKYTIVSKNDALSIDVTNKLHQKLQEISMFKDDNNPEMIITVGGDGTVLKAVHQYLNIIDKVVFVGIHTGKLGFYTDFIHNDIDSFVAKIKQDKYEDVSFPLLSAYVSNHKTCVKYNALNEFTLLNPYRTQHLDVYINDVYFESFQGTGLCISTPSGSSAFNKSLGGALIHPKIQAFQFTEIASINSNVYRTISSPLIIPKEQYLTLKTKDFNEVILSIDHMHTNLKNFDHIKFVLSDKVVRFRQYYDNDFWKRVQKSFL